MIQGNRRLAKQPVPLIDPTRCDGCGLCVRVCPTGALAVQDGEAVVATPEACNYTGLCEAICPTGAIHLDRPVSWVLELASPRLFWVWIVRPNLGDKVMVLS